MLISPFTPFHFSPHKHDGIDSGYIQTFAYGDNVLIEVLCAPNEETGDWNIYKEPGHIALDSIEYNQWDISEDSAVQFAILTLSPGLYSIGIGGLTSNIFRVTDDPVELENTTLIQYSMRDNRQRTDAVFFIDGMQRFFDFRVPGGFKDSNWTFAVEGEQFVTDKADIVTLYGLESTQKKFTLGNSGGCPVWFAEMLNRILCCNYVYFDGERYARKESATPEMNVLVENVNSFVFTQNLQKVSNLDPVLTQAHQVLMRRTSTSENGNYRAVSENTNRIII